MKQNTKLSYPEINKKAISLTAYRAIYIVTLLSKSPKSFEELLEAIHDDKFLSKACHKDTITNSINSLRAAGFVIDKPKASNGYKFTLISNPFKFKISQEQADLLHLMRTSLSYQSNYEIIFKLNSVFDKITKLGDCEKYIDTIERSNYFRTIDRKILNKILALCDKKANARIVYNSPINGNEELKVKLEKIVFENNRLYLWLYSYKYNTPGYFRVDKILDIIQDTPNEDENISLTNFVEYELKGEAAKKFIPKENEIILEKLTDKITIKANVINKFNFFQYIMAFSDNCKILSPDSIKQDFAEHLKNIMEVYTNNVQ